MIELFEEVILLVNLPDKRLEQGAVGVVVMIHGNHVGYEVEFMTLKGSTVAVETLRADQVRPVSNLDMAHVRFPTSQSIQVLADVPISTEPASITLPVSTALTIDLSNELLKQKGITLDQAKLQLAIALFQQDFFSLGKASEFAGLHPTQFQKELAQRQISVHYDVDEYQHDIDTLDDFTKSLPTYHEV